MVRGNLTERWWLPALLVCSLLVTSLSAQNMGGRVPPGARPLRMAAAPAAGAQPAPPLRVADRSEVDPRPVPAQPPGPQPNEHPLMPALRWAHSGLADVERIKDYSATLAKRERIDGKLNDYEYMFIKLRHKPFSVYMYFLKPVDIKGQEVLFVEGQNNGRMWAHTVGLKDKMFGTVSLPPNGPFAMRGQHYPLTELGIVNLVRRLVEVGEQDIKYGECEVKFFKGAKINDRVCTCIEVTHPKPRRNFLFYVARIFVDDELNVPIRYESHDWPSQPGGPPELIEEYTYLNLKLNNGFTDADFDIRNPNYHFR